MQSIQESLQIHCQHWAEIREKHGTQWVNPLVASTSHGRVPIQVPATSLRSSFLLLYLERQQQMTQALRSLLPHRRTRRNPGPWLWLGPALDSYAGIWRLNQWMKNLSPLSLKSVFTLHQKIILKRLKGERKKAQETTEIEMIELPCGQHPKTKLRRFLCNYLQPFDFSLKETCTVHFDCT